MASPDWLRRAWMDHEPAVRRRLRAVGRDLLAKYDPAGDRGKSPGTGPQAVT